MKIAIVLFWSSFSVLFYCYIGHGILLFLFNKLRAVLFFHGKKEISEGILPVTLIVAVYNEVLVLESKIRNTLAIDYPADKLKIIFVDDASTDGSENLIKQFPSITLFSQTERKGKYMAIKKAMRFVQTPVVIFSDANAMINEDAIKKIVTHYKKSNVGGVAGEKRIKQNHHISAVGEAEGLYWKYESFLKKQDSDFYSVVGAAGELFSIRTELFQALEDDLILDDFIISMQVCLQGYRIKYEPKAFSTETASASLMEEKKGRPGFQQAPINLSAI